MHRRWICWSDNNERRGRVYEKWGTEINAQLNQMHCMLLLSDREV